MLPSPEQARANCAHARNTRIKAACERMRPRVAEAMNAGKTQLPLCVALKEPTPQYALNSMGAGNGDFLWTERYEDVAREAGEAMRREIEEAGWFASLEGDVLHWRDLARPS